MAMNLDIAIIPLADLPFNHYKSSIKFYEMSAMGTPSLVSNILPYSEDVEHDVNALGYNTAEEFKNGLETLLNSSKTRSRLAKAAQKYVKDNFNMEKQANIWIDAYKEIL